MRRSGWCPSILEKRAVTLTMMFDISFGRPDLRVSLLASRQPFSLKKSGDVASDGGDRSVMESFRLSTTGARFTASDLCASLTDTTHLRSASGSAAGGPDP